MASCEAAANLVFGQYLLLVLVGRRRYAGFRFCYLAVPFLVLQCVEFGLRVPVNILGENWDERSVRLAALVERRMV
jgi:hypothetical protein